MATVIQLSYFKLNSCNWSNCDCFQKSKENTTDLHRSVYCYSTLLCCNIHNGRDCRDICYLQNKNFESDAIGFKYPPDFEFLKSAGFCRNPSHPYSKCPGVTYKSHLQNS